MTAREPVLVPVQISALRPTQMTVGRIEVARKRRDWRERTERGGAEFLGRHMIPVLLGPGEHHFIIDHHHLACALQAEEVKEVAVNVLADLRQLSKPEFWVYCDNRGLCHPFDAQGERRGYDDIPEGLEGLADDPFRSLAGELRRAGGFAKEVTPFEEFTWADFLRRRIKASLIDDDFPAALAAAAALAHTPAAAHLPGWCGRAT
jgi:hypothetical protein